MINYAIALVFLLFAAFQYNDPDPLVWIIIYGAVAIAYLWKGLPKKMLYFIAIFLAIYMVSYIPSFVEWIKDDLPSITGTMKAENPEVENIREFLGLGLAVSALVFLIKQRK
jgi:hypothetical protein